MSRQTYTDTFCPFKMALASMHGCTAWSVTCLGIDGNTWISRCAVDKVSREDLCFRVFFRVFFEKIRKSGKEKDRNQQVENFVQLRKRKCVYLEKLTMLLAPRAN